MHVDSSPGSTGVSEVSPGSASENSANKALGGFHGLPTELWLQIMEILAQRNNQKSLLEISLASRGTHVVAFPALLSNLAVTDQTFTRRQMDAFLEDKLGELSGHSKFRHVRSLALRFHLLSDLEARLLRLCLPTLVELEFTYEDADLAPLIFGQKALPCPNLERLAIWPYGEFHATKYGMRQQDRFGLPPSIRKLVFKACPSYLRQRALIEAVDPACDDPSCKLMEIELDDEWTPMLPLDRYKGVASKLCFLRIKMDYLDSFLKVRPFLTSLSMLEVSGISGGGVKLGQEQLGGINVNHVILRGKTDCCLLPGLSGSFECLELHCPRPRLTLVRELRVRNLVLAGFETSGLLAGLPEDIETLELWNPKPTLQSSEFQEVAAILRASDVRLIIIRGIIDWEDSENEHVFWRQMKGVQWIC